MHTTICRMLLTLQSSTLVLPSSWTPKVRIPAVSALKGSFLPALHVRAHLCDSFLCPRAAGCCWLTWWYRQRGRQRTWDISSSKLSSGSTRALNPVFIYWHVCWPGHIFIKSFQSEASFWAGREAEELQPMFLWGVCAPSAGARAFCVTGQEWCARASFFLLVFQCLRTAAGEEIFWFSPVSLRFTWTDIGLSSSLQMLTQHWSCQLAVVLSTHTDTRGVLWLCTNCGKVWDVTVKPKGPKL